MGLERGFQGEAIAGTTVVLDLVRRREIATCIRRLPHSPGLAALPGLSFCPPRRPFVATRAEIHSMAARSPLMTYPVAVKTPPRPERSPAGRGFFCSARSARRSRASRNDPTRPAFAGMDKLFLAVVVSGLLVLVAAAGLFTLARDTAVEAPAYAVRQRH